MKIIPLFLLLFAVSAHGAEERPRAPALTPQLQAVERQLVRNGVSEDDAQATLRAMIQAGFTEEQVVRAGQQLVPDNRRGPTGEAVRDKIHEGIAKGVPPETILAAAARVRSRLDLAGKFAGEVNETENKALVGIFADCLAAGLTEQHARQLTMALRNRIGTPGTSGTKNLATETLLTAREMVRQNIASTTTASVLASALARGYTDEGMRSLRQSLAGSSGDLENNAKRLGAAIDRGARAGELQGLGNSGIGTGERSGAGMGQGGSDSGGGAGGDSGGGAGGDSGGGAGGDSGGDSGGGAGGDSGGGAGGGSGGDSGGGAGGGAGGGSGGGRS